jgi:hypothetical protein
MSDINKIEMLKYNISRFDHYYASVNFKSSFFVVASITLLGFLYSQDNIGVFALVLITFLTALTIIFVLCAIKPYLKSYNQKEGIVFFGDISNQTDDEFEKKISNINEEDYIKDLTKQNKILASGLKDKFDYLNKATIVFMANIVIYFFTIVF